MEFWHPRHHEECVYCCRLGKGGGCIHIGRVSGVLVGGMEGWRAWRLDALEGKGLLSSSWNLIMTWKGSRMPFFLLHGFFIGHDAA